MDPQQELFTKLKLDILALGYDEYDGFLPPEETEYPFVYLADSRMYDSENKSAVHGSVMQTVHVWHNDPRKRGTVSNMLLEIKRKARRIEHTNNFAWHLRDVSQQILPDDTTKQPLLHGVLEFEYYFS